MASTRLVVRPSWRKKMRCPTPQRGAVRNSSGPAPPCVMPSVRRFAQVGAEKVGVKIRRLIGKRSARAGRGAARDLCARGKRGSMAVDTTNPCKSDASFLAGRGGGCGWGQHPHEVGKGF